MDLFKTFSRLVAILSDPALAPAWQALLKHLLSLSPTQLKTFAELQFTEQPAASASAVGASAEEELPPLDPAALPALQAIVAECCGEDHCDHE